MAGGVTTAVDVTRLVERLAHRLAASGARHPVAAAVAIACRGNTARDLDSFASWVGLPHPLLMACEAGEVAFADLPDAVLTHHEGLDLLALADLDLDCAARSAGNVR
jgi:hypothetical protein